MGDAVATRTRHAIDPNAPIADVPNAGAKLSPERTTLLCLTDVGDKAVPLTKKLGDMNVRYGLDRSDTLRSKHVRFDASFPRMLRARPSIEDILHAEIGKHLVEASFHKASRVPINRSEGSRIRDRDMVRRETNKWTYDTYLVVQMAGFVMLQLVPYRLWRSSTVTDQRFRQTTQNIQASVNLVD